MFEEIRTEPGKFGKELRGLLCENIREGAAQTVLPRYILNGIRITWIGSEMPATRII